MRLSGWFLCFLFGISGCAELVSGISSEQSAESAERDAGETPTEPNGVTDAGTQPDASFPSPPDGPHDPPPPLSPWQPSAPVAAMGDSARASLKRDLDAMFAGTTHSVRVIDLSANVEIYTSQPDLTLKPASNTKLFTTAAALDMLGSEHRFPTQVFASQPPTASSIEGELVIVPEHDFFATTDFYASNDAPIRQAAAEIRALGFTRVAGNVQMRGEAVIGGSSVGSYNAQAHRASMANAWHASLKTLGVAVAGNAQTAIGFSAPAGAKLVFTTHSLPLYIGCSPLNVRSHNEYADLLVRHLGHAIEGESSFAAGTRSVIDWLSAAGIDTKGMALNDGSGLSHNNRISARQVTELLRFMLQTPVAEDFERSFTIAGVRGTLGSRMTGADTKGRVWGKTGTLTGVVATSGLLDHRHDAHRYAFSMLTNGVASSTTTRNLHDRAIARLAARYDDILPISAPELSSVQALAKGVARVRMTQVNDASTYLVAWSDDPETFPAEQVRAFTTPDVVLGELAVDGPIYLRVHAMDARGKQSRPSDTYAVRASSDGPRVLLVDGNDRWQGRGVDNPRNDPHPYLAYWTRAFSELAKPSPWAGARVDAVDNDFLLAEPTLLHGYDLLVFALGEEGSDDETFSTAEQALVRAWVGQGKPLIVSGAEVGYDLVSQGNEADRAFFRDILHAQYVADSAGTFQLIRPPALQRTGHGTPLSFFTPDRMRVAHPDVVAATADAEPLLQYLDGRTAAVGFAGGAYLAFPLESIDNADDRMALLALVLADIAPSTKANVDP